jgi:hypothetical protein
VQSGDRAPEAEEPIQGTPHLDLSEDVFTDAESAPEAPPLDDSALERESPPVDERAETSADELH